MNTTVSTLAYVEPVIRSVHVAATPARAFEVFSTGIGRWWIPTHSILASKAPQASVTIEWVGIHQRPMPVLKTSNARAGVAATRTLRITGSVSYTHLTLPTN